MLNLSIGDVKLTALLMNIILWYGKTASVCNANAWNERESWVGFEIHFDYFLSSFKGVDKTWNFQLTSNGEYLRNINTRFSLVQIEVK